MRDNITKAKETCESFYVELLDKKVTDVVVTNHAEKRFHDRIQDTNVDIARWAWECLKQGRMKPYYRNEQDVYLIDDDIVMVAEFADVPNENNIHDKPLHKMIVVTFLGKMSETMELRDLKSYYSWLRHSRRMTLIKNTRKRR
ncbi:hypothetical protein J2Z32_001099 [Paenibacillus turicensis]|uniref:Periplasmic protein n=1 Tax=Paenibacillus turicensis TaxID=160487 RepID=A0ABS4FPI4_9BACL|nr:hypothetical protein [Paenibacillus turicensis]MBP1904482.1 hypothetical protein [Paenibacillus turicensis]